MDSLNSKILTELQNNARITFAEIGRRIGLSAPSVAERVQKLQDSGVIEGYTTNLNLSKLGLGIEAIINLEISYNGYKKLMNNIENIPEIYECLKVTGKYCVIIKVAVKDNSELDRVIDKISMYGQPQTSIILSRYLNKTITLSKK